MKKEIRLSNTPANTAEKKNQENPSTISVRLRDNYT
jgi:hypothetical protein